MLALLTPPPFIHESAADYLMRLSFINGVPLSRKFMRSLGFNLSDCLHGRDIDSILAKINRTDLQILKQFTPEVTTKKRVRMNGQELHRDDWTTQRRRWCPDCWRGDQSGPMYGRSQNWALHRRFWWNVTAVSTCPIHCVRLEEMCPFPGCGCPINWQEGTLVTCPKGHSLLECVPAAVPKEHTLADRYIVDCLCGREVEKPPLIKDHELWEAHDVMERFGVASIGGAYGALSKIPAEQHAAVYSKGLTIIMGWPDRFIQLLDQLGHARAEGNWGIETLYGYLYLWAKRLPSNVFGQEVRAVFSRVGELGFTRKTKIVLHTTKNFVSIADVQAQAGLSAARVKALLPLCGFETLTVNKGTPASIPVEVVERLKSMMADVVNRKEAQEYLGVHQRNMESFVEQGLLRPHPVLNQLSAKEYVFQRADLDAFMERLTSGLPVVKKVPTGKKPLGLASQEASVGGLAGVLKLALAGHLKFDAVLAGPQRLNSIITSSKSILRAEREYEGCEYTYYEAASILGMHAESVRRLVRGGFISGWLLPSGQLGIPRQAISDFQQEFITGGQLAKVYGTNAAKIDCALRASGVYSEARYKKLRWMLLYRRGALPNPRTMDQLLRSTHLKRTTAKSP